MVWFKKKQLPDEALEEAITKSSSSKTEENTASHGGSATSSSHSSGGQGKPGQSSARPLNTNTGAPLGNDPTHQGFVAPEVSLIERRFGKLRSALGPGTEVQGRLSFDSAVSLDGVLKGTIRSTELIVVSKLGRVEATSLVAKSLVIEGEVTGEDVTVSDRLEVLAGGRFIGSVSTPTLVVADGGVFDGVCKMTTREEAAGITIPPLSASKNSSVTTPLTNGVKTNSTKPNGSKSGVLPTGDGQTPKKKITMDELLGK